MNLNKRLRLIALIILLMSVLVGAFATIEYFKNNNINNKETVKIEKENKDDTVTLPVVREENLIETKIVVVKATGLNLRTLPSMDGEIIKVLPQGTVLESVKVKDTEWLNVPGGYVSSKYVCSEEEFVIFMEQEKVRKEKEEKERKENKARNINRGGSVGFVNLTYSPNTPSNLSHSEISKLLAGSGLVGIEDAVIELERTHGINALFTIAVAKHESGHGNSPLAKSHNNLFGLRVKDGYIKFNNKSDSVRSFGKSIVNIYFNKGRTTLEAIQPVYAPPNHDWDEKVLGLMKELVRKLK